MSSGAALPSEWREDPSGVVLRADAPSPADGEDPDPSLPLLLNIEGFEGPIDVLLQLARDQKVDLARISILELARQYLAFIDRAQALRLDLAAEYLVMAAWLAYLKSRLLLPRAPEDAEEPDGATMAEALAFQLRRLEAMQQAGKALMARPRLGERIFARGAPEVFPILFDTAYDATLYDLLRAYGDIRKRAESAIYAPPGFTLMSMDEALERVTAMLGRLPRQGAQSVWTTLASFLPAGTRDRLLGRSALASTFTASLELAKQGRVEIRQDGAFRPIYVRANFPDEHAGAAHE